MSSTRQTRSQKKIADLEARVANLEQKVAAMEKRKLSGASTQVNSRTIAMRRFLLESIPGYDRETNTLLINGKEYQIITSDVHRFSGRKKPLVSCGSALPRELIIMDRYHSPLLQKIYGQYKSVILDSLPDPQSVLTASQLINITARFMRDFVFNKSTNSGVELDELVNRYKQNPIIPNILAKDQISVVACIPIDVFIKEHLGSCRHHAMVAAYLLDRFTRNHAKLCDFKATIQIMRDYVINEERSSAHAWVSMITREGNQNKTYALDSANQYAGFLEDVKFATLFGSRFGEWTVQHQLEKADKVKQLAINKW